MPREIKAELPAKLAPLLEPRRYKALHGGRGGAKSHAFAALAIIRCLAAPTRIACIREVQASIRDSVRQLLVDKITALDVQDQFLVLDAEIRGTNGSLIVFKGMQSYNATNIKSLEGYDIAWVEEAQTLSAVSLRMLRPTIRAPGSELWFSWNPRHDTDPVDLFFRGAPRDDATVIEMGWEDNPWVPDELRAEMMADYADDPDMAEHVWGGGYETITDAAYYARLIVAAEKAGRIGHFPANPALPVITGWDIGVDDYTAVWFAQVIRHGDPRLRVIDYAEFQGMGVQDVMEMALPEYSADPAPRLAEIGRSFPYRYSRHYFPHDIRVREWGAGARTRVEAVMECGVPMSRIGVGAQTGPEDRHQAVRTLLPRCEFAQTERVMLGVRRLRRYRRRLNEATRQFVGPLKDGNDHGADAFGEMAINVAVLAALEPADPVVIPKLSQVMLPARPNVKPGRIAV